LFNKIKKYFQVRKFFEMYCFSAEVPDWQTLAMEIIELLISLPLAAPFLEEVSPQEAPNYR
jgi:hypothetical protein